MIFCKKKVIIFDLDGTLIDSSPDLALAINDMLKQLGRDCFATKIIDSWIGNGVNLLVKRALLGGAAETSHLDPAFFEKALSLFLASYEKNVCVKTTIYPRVASSLNALKTMGYQLTIVTNKPKQFVQPILDTLGIGDLFEIILGGSCLVKRKPDPLPLQIICERLSVTVEECVMVGDSKNDILAANALAMDSIAVSYGYNYGEDISNYNPTVLVSDFADIVALSRKCVKYLRQRLMLHKKNLACNAV
jgi:phosphoglycolate phosphatase